jgi:hypothetical protein
VAEIGVDRGWRRATTKALASAAVGGHAKAGRGCVRRWSRQPRRRGEPSRRTWAPSTAACCHGRA